MVNVIILSADYSSIGSVSTCCVLLVDREPALVPHQTVNGERAECNRTSTKIMDMSLTMLGMMSGSTTWKSCEVSAGRERLLMSQASK